jgi:hypothetical protein
LATYEQPYVPYFRLVSTEALSNEAVNCFGYEVPNRFVCNVCVVSDNGKPLPKAVAENYPVFIVSMIVNVSRHGNPEITSVELKGETYSRKILMGLELRDFHFKDVKPLTPWQLSFVAKYRSELIRLGIENVTRWKRSNKDGKTYWSMTFENNAKVLGEAEKLKLKKDVQKRLSLKLTDDFYEQLAKQYLNYIQAGLEPILELSKDYPESNHRTIQRWATESRKRGFLPKTTQGKVSRVTKRKGKNANTKKAKSR